MNNQENDISFGNINASSLFHFTKELSTLKLILQNGVRFSYAFENYPQSVISNFCDITDITNTNEDLGVAIPMASFCDIPITRASEHMQKYGYYSLGFRNFVTICVSMASKFVFLKRNKPAPKLC